MSPAETPATDTGESRPFLLEIGSEEIPARFVPASRRELEGRAAELLAELHLEHGTLRTLATPRRLALLVDDLAVRQPDRELEIKGPPVKVAFDAAGQPTPAALGFARKNGVELDACERASDARGEYLLVRKIEAGRPATEVLGERLPELVLGIPFRKVMRWGTLTIEYARPLQWLVALLGSEIVPTTVGVLASGRTTRGHRTLSGDARVEIPAPATYQDILAGVGVIVDQDSREKTICTGLDAAAVALGGRWRQDDALLAEVVQLCEHPTVFAGGFEAEFFELPPEVIVTALKAHQRYFAVEQAEGTGLLPHFLAVRDGGADHLDNVVAGNERVLRARLADALFYWRFDQKRTPEEHAAALDAVTWLEGFGSVGDKCRRLEKLAPAVWLGGLGDEDAVPSALLRAARICKFDLVSEMIKDGKEFTKLEGLIGSRYARQAGEEEEVCRAIEEHHRPRGAGDEPPERPVSAALSVTDRLDTLVGCWLAGFQPTGAKDPYALRRHSLAVLRTVLDRAARVDLAELLRTAVGEFASLDLEIDREAVSAEVLAFMRTRLARYLTDALGCDPDVVRAVLPIRGHDPTDALAWIRALAGFRDQADFQLLATGFKRCKNILQGEVLPPQARAAARDRWERGGESQDGRSFDVLSEPAETGLRDRIAAAVPELRSAENAGDYTAVFRTLAGFGPDIDAYFDSVRVNVENEELRTLRHAFLREVHALFGSYADFSAVAPAE